MNWLGPSWITVDLDAITHNLNEIRKLTRAKICVVLKGDAYGHGLVVIAKHCQSLGVEYIAVHDLAEASDLRKNGIKLPILILSPCLPEQIPEIIALNVTITVTSMPMIAALANYTSLMRKTSKIHLKVNTGMNRVGISPDTALTYAKTLTKNPYLLLEGVYTHFAAANKDRAYTIQQYQRFADLKTEFIQHGYTNLIWHAANSAAFLNYPTTHLDLVRIGTLLFGQSLVKVPDGVMMLPTWQLFSRIIEVKQIAKNEPIGYGMSYITKKDTVIGIIPLGYGDGLGVEPDNDTGFRAVRHALLLLLDNPHVVYIDNKPYPIIGKIAMGMCCIDLTSHPQASDLYGKSVQVPARRITMNRRIPKLYIKQTKLHIVYWQDKLWQPQLRNNQVYIKALTSYQNQI